MDLILWRHAEAEDGAPDLERRLTAKGRKQAEKVAKWLDRRLPDGCRVIASPARRARETADALGRSYELVDGIAPGAGGDEILQAAGWPGAGGAVLLVGHQPALGEAAARAVSGLGASWSIRKGGVFWIASRERDDGSPAIVRAVISADLL